MDGENYNIRFVDVTDRSWPEKAPPRLCPRAVRAWTAREIGLRSSYFEKVAKTTPPTITATPRSFIGLMGSTGEPSQP